MKKGEEFELDGWALNDADDPVSFDLAILDTVRLLEKLLGWSGPSTIRTAP